MIVYKFGGTSLGSAERFEIAAGLVAACAEAPVVVVSAVAGVTTRLEALARDGGEVDARMSRLETLRELHDEIARAMRAAAAAESVQHSAGEPGPLPEPTEERIEGIFARLEELLQEDPPPDEGGRGIEASARRVDAACAAGEDLSAALMTLALRNRGLKAREVDAREIVRTDAHHGRAIPLDEESREQARERLAPLVAAGEVPVLQGFVGATMEGVTTTLGRGGSDFTAAIVGAALGAGEVTIWTDVDGIFSADPGQVPDARILRELGYEEAVELSYFGARVIHPAAAKHAVARDISLRIRSSFHPDDPGTLIRHDRRETPKVAAVACKPGVTLLTVRSRPLFMAHGFLARVFEVLSRHRLPVDLVATSHSSTAFTIDEDQDLEAVIRELDDFAEVEVTEKLATVSVVGRGLMGEPGITARVLGSLGHIRVHLVSQASDVTLSFLVTEDHGVEAARYIHRSLIAGGPIRTRREIR